MSGYIRYSFAVDGERVAIDTSTQPSGVISLQSGYPSGYSLPQSNPLSKNIERPKFNELMYLVTTAIRILQQQGAPDFIESSENGGAAYSYAKYARCFRSGVAYESLVNANTDVPPSANWKIVDDLATTLIRGLIKKSTQAELNTGVANVWPDAATIFNGFVQTGTTDGYIKLPEWMGGLIVQWGSYTTGDLSPGVTEYTINYPTPFTTVFNVSISSISVVGNDIGFISTAASVGNSNFVARLQELAAVGQGAGAGFKWLAIGK